MRNWMLRHDVIVDSPNKRIKVMNGMPKDDAQFFKKLSRLEINSKCTKTTIYTKKEHITLCLDKGFGIEGCIDGFYNGQNAYLLTRYQDEQRATSKSLHKGDQTLQIVQSNQAYANRKTLPPDLSLRQANIADAPALSSLFRLVFPSYPTPVYDPNYLIKTMENTIFMIIQHGERIVSVCSAEITSKQSCAEMTDCATHPDFRGQSLLSYLFFALEEQLEEMGIFYLFSLTRAISVPMNLTVARHGYKYRGRLINNCVIYSGFEDMFIWVKPLRATWD